MQTIQLSERSAREMYPSAPNEIKRMLEDSFPEGFFTQDITERIQTVEDACKYLGKDFNSRHDGCKDEYEKAEADIKIFAEALRDGTPPSECWHYPYFRRSSGGGFSFDDCVDDFDYSDLGARLRVRTPKDAEHMGKSLEAQYKIYING
ncbi:hypothetical protein ACTJIJ_19750 [Niabella sp. 22666]|uniref:hypothetical protein n=1 Tax=Niabella sp. 22666 TaxID=3453954 RepID=UPI003F86376B